MEQPIPFVVDAQEVGKLYVQHASPYQYNQFLLERLRTAGGPVEGVLELKLTHGRLALCRDDQLSMPGVFVYMWLPNELAAKLAAGSELGVA